MARVSGLVVLLSLLAVPALLPRADDRVAAAVNGRGWREVLQWLSEVSGKPVVGPKLPSGTCRLPSRPGGRLTMNEIVDRFNDELFREGRPERFYLHVRSRAIVLLPWEPDVDTRERRIAVADLPEYPGCIKGDVAIRVERRKATALKSLVKNRMGPTGEAVGLPSTNVLLLRDEVHHLRRVVRFVQLLEAVEARE